MTAHVTPLFHTLLNFIPPSKWNENKMSQFRSKRNKYDITFSEFIILRDGFCQRCGAGGRLECSHIHGRANMGVRCDPRNAKALCNTCHRWWHSFPLLASEWCQGIMGEFEFVKLLQLAKTPSKMTAFDKDYIRKEQQTEIIKMKAGNSQLKPWSLMFRKS